MANLLKKTGNIPAEIGALMVISFCAFSAYHAPQPLFPSIREAFGIPQSSVTLITTCVILPLGLSPIAYGLILNRLPLVRTLTVALALYGLSLLPSPLGGNWPALLAGRLVQGFTLPAIILCVMTYISTRYEGKALQRYMGFYAVSCMLGGFSGRVVAGAVERVTGDWRMAFAFMALVVLAALPCTRMLRDAAKGRFASMNFSALGKLLRQKGMLKLLLIAPCLALTNNSILNVLPFRLQDIAPGISPLAISIVYIGVVVCSVTGIFSTRIIRLLRTEMRAVIVSILGFMLFMPLLLLPSPTALFFVLIGLNSGYSFMYACMPGLVNRFSETDRAVTNGAFLSCYYLSGAAGTYFPSIIFEHFGFAVYLACLALPVFAALAAAFSMRDAPIGRGER